MQLTDLRITNLRALQSVEIALEPGWNFFLGPNGAGKTSLLEAVFLLSHGRSFRRGARDVLDRVGSGGYAIFAQLQTAVTQQPVGIARIGNRQQAKLAGQTVPAAELMRHVAVLCFEPGSHELIAGASEERRQFLDWGVFHVEHEFLSTWRRYNRALRQRNALLRMQANDTEMDPWDRELDAAAAPLTQMRRQYFASLQPILTSLLQDLLGELGQSRLAYLPGFNPDLPFADVLASRRARDRARGHTTAGPHRADWSVVFEHATQREHLSRGQEKLCAFACILAQAQLFRATRGEWPILCLDDPASEVDREHQQKILGAANASGAQILATATSAPEGFARLQAAANWFHVELGCFTGLL